MTDNTMPEWWWSLLVIGVSLLSAGTLYGLTAKTVPVLLSGIVIGLFTTIALIDLFWENTHA